MSDYVAKALFGRHDLLTKSAAQITEKVAETAARQTEQIILQQLNELVSRGLIVIEETQPMLSMVLMCAEQDAYELRITRGVRLLLKDQEYIEKLEKQVEDLTNRLLEVNAHMDEVNERLQKITVAMKQNKE
jgi:hypothetical protein